MGKTTRRSFIRLMGGMATYAATSRFANAKTPTLYVCGYSDIQDIIRKEWISPFEKTHDVKVQYTPIAGMELLGKIRAEQANPQHSVMLTDDWAINYAKRFNLLAPLPQDEMVELQALDDKFHLEDGHGVAVLANKIGLGYNTTVKPPASWGDLWDSGKKRSILVPTVNLSTSIMLLAMAASLRLGKPISEAQYDLDAGFTHLRELKPNILTIYSSTANAISLLAQGEASLAAPFFAKNIFRHAERGAPLGLTTPAEGAFVGISGAALIKGSPQLDLAGKFINFGLSAAVQRALAINAGAGSVNPRVQLPEDMALRAPINATELNKLHRLDWREVNDNRDQIIERWNREIAT